MVAMHSMSTLWVSPQGSLSRSVVAFLRDELNLGALWSGPIRGPLPGVELDVMDGGAGKGNALQRKGVADKDVSVRTAHDLLADSEADRLNDVALLAVRVVNEGDAEAAVGIVLDGGYGAGDAELVALEVDYAQLLLVAAAVVTYGLEGLVLLVAACAPLDSEQKVCAARSS